MSPRVGEMVESKFLKKEDVGERGVLVTISGCGQVNVSKEGAEPILKWGLSFEELEKPMVLNSTNINACAKVCGSDNTDNWIGKQIVLYEDPNVVWAGKPVGGIRIRAPRSQAAPLVPTKKPTPVADLGEENVPF